MMNFLLVTNNPLVEKNYGNFAEKVDGGLFEVLIRVRDYIHKGHSLLMHPLPGSIKPNETFYRSLLITRGPLIGRTDFKSLELIENSLTTYKKFNHNECQYTEKVLEDYQSIDLELVKSAVESLHS